MTDLSGKTALVTGGTNGIGFETAVALARMGAKVVIVGRDPAKTAAKIAEAKRRSGSVKIEALLCDFASQAQVRRLAAEFRNRYDRLDILVNNAGTVFPKRVLTEDGIESTFAVNHLGYFLLTNLLLDLLQKSAPSRVVNVASAGHYRGTMNFDDLGFERGYGTFKAYARSKLANVLFTRELAKRLAGTGVTVNSLHPGAVATGIWAHGSNAGFGKALMNVVSKLFMRTVEQGAETIIYLASSPEVAGKSGLYFEDKKERWPLRAAQDDALAAKLWEASAKLVKL